MGLEAGGGQLDHLRAMSGRGAEVFRRHFSYFHNPRGVADGVLFETYALMRDRGIVNPRPSAV